MNVKIRKLQTQDIPAAMRLKEIAGWNQLPADWEAYLQLEPHGCFAAETDGRVVATTTTINYGNRFGWIGMVIVDPDFRRRGVATRMIKRAVDYLEAADCRCQKLDATEAGARVYERMGFTVEYEVQRWLRPAPQGGLRASPPDLRVLVANDLEKILDLDRRAFGASRLNLLRWYCVNQSPSFWALADGEPVGYVVARPGSGAWQMGPLVAKEQDVAQDLMTRFLAEVETQPVIADVIADHKEAVDLLVRWGFERKRRLYRMYRGQNAWPGTPLETFCLAGFEYG